MSIRKLTGNAPLLGHPLRGLAALGGYSILAATIATSAAISTMAGTALSVTPSGEGISVSVPAGAVDAE